MAWPKKKPLDDEHKAKISKTKREQKRTPDDAERRRIGEGTKAGIKKKKEREGK